MAIVSLTSIPPRFAALGSTLESLLAQRPAPEAVLLCLPRGYRRFPGPVTPPKLPEGVRLVWSDVDHGPALKLLPALRAVPDPASEIAICDDDWLYGPGWLSALKAARRPGVAVAGSTWEVRRLKRQGGSVVQGFAGVLLRAGMFDAQVLCPPPEAWAVDDIWISGQLARRGVGIVEAPAARAAITPRDSPGALQGARVDGRSRAAANAACTELLYDWYGIWPPLDRA
ncbi:hypothetical protein [Salipiger mucosus]|uniref:Glycosyltransferase n=1 Tax=Salipiger mucosus DSM 16094 TaxID=1123237 RepID=S9RDY4_9RHOB|nr:hypothetical protein [Salipiger mucosus]EPX76335.1 hypothetical protein Salmuc_00151 [Salipiger mucosus DSM 16094]